MGSCTTRYRCRNPRYFRNIRDGIIIIHVIIVLNSCNIYIWHHAWGQNWHCAEDSSQGSIRHLSRSHDWSDLEHIDRIQLKIYMNSILPSLSRGNQRRYNMLFFGNIILISSTIAHKVFNSLILIL